MQHDYDLLIVGAGLAGNCLAWALKDSGLRIAVIEAASSRQLRESPTGDRALALAAGTVRQLQALGIWDGVADAATAIRTIHISDRGHFGKTRLSAERQGVSALGYVIAARDIESHVAELAERTAATYLYDTRIVGLMAGFDAVNVSLKSNSQSSNLSAALLVGADGGQSSVRKLLNIGQQVTDYGQTALVTTVTHALPHRNTAFERFTAFGPLAMLPSQGKQSSVVWTRSHEDAAALMAGGETDFIAQLQDCFGYRLGQLTLAAPRRAFPLSLIRADAMIAPRTVMIGNAVHHLHPVAGQGFNLGLRDVTELAELLLNQAPNDDLGDHVLLECYAQSRQRDHEQTILFTDSVVKIFSNDWLPLAALRNTGLALLDQLPVAKNLLSRQAMGLAGRLPRIGNRR